MYPGVIWDYPDKEKKVYLTFDDGPHPETTPRLIEILKDQGVEASFFCTGKNVDRFPDLFQQYQKNGHLVGHHTYDHLNGFYCSSKKYMKDVLKGDIMKSKYFRPPYGKLKPHQLSKIKSNYKVILWDVLSKDYKMGITTNQCLNNVLNHIKMGSIIVFHENDKAKNIMLQVVPLLINRLKRQGWKFGLIH